MYFCKKSQTMTRLVLEISSQHDLDVLLPLLKRLKIRYAELDNPIPSDEKILAALRVIREGCDMSNYGDALDYQMEQRQERALPNRD